jgi:hypothetical protein
MSRSLQIQTMLSMRWRIGSRCGPPAGLVVSACPENGGAHVADAPGELASGIALAAAQADFAFSMAASKALERASRSPSFGDAKASAPGVRGADRAQPETPEVHAPSTHPLHNPLQP